MAIFWRYVVLRDHDPTQSIPSTRFVIVALGGIVVRALELGGPSRWPWLKALELGMIGMLAAGFAFVQYRLMLDFSLRGEPMHGAARR